MKVLVTGGSGFLGAEILKKLLQRNFKVFNLDLIKSNISGVVNFQIDILDKKKMNDIFANNVFDIIIHSCAKVPVSRSKDSFYDVNVIGTKNILSLAKIYLIKRFVYVSSSAVYGIPEKVPILEEDIRVPLEPYGISKKMGEDLCIKEMPYMNLGIIRPRTVIGKDRLGIFSILFEWIRSNKAVPVINDGKNLYQFIDVDDLAEAICIMSLSKYVGSLNIGTSSFCSIRELLTGLIEKNHSSSKIKNLDSNLLFKLFKFLIKKVLPLQEYHYLAYGRDIYFDTSQSKLILKWEPKISNLVSLQNSYENYIKSTKYSHELLATHKKPLKSFLLKYATWFF